MFSCYKHVWKTAPTIKSILYNRFTSPTSFVTDVDFITCIRILKVKRLTIQTLNFSYIFSRDIRYHDKKWIFFPSIKCFGKHYSTQSSKPYHSKLNKKQLITEKFYEKKKQFKESSQVLLKDIKETKDKVKEKVEEVIEKENIVTIPNILCVLRIALSPYLGYLILDSHYNIAVGIFAFAGFTDLIDGWIARSFPSQSSKLGSFLDPMADKVLVATLFLTLTYMEQVPIPLTCLIVIRDMLLVAAGFYIRYRSLPAPRTLSRYFDVTHATAQLAPTFISKINTAVQLSLAATTLAAPVFNYVDHPALHILWYITAGTTIASAISYIVSHNTYRFLKSNPRRQNN